MSTEAEIDALVEQLREKALWREDIHHDLHIAAADLITKLRAERDAATREDMVLVPKAALLWLTGEAPDADGKWFGETIGEGLPKIAGKYPRTYWWRSKFRSMIPNWPEALEVIATDGKDTA